MRRKTHFTNNKIPQVLHLYWGREKLSYLHYLTPISFIKYNPGWEVVIHEPISPGTEPTWKSGEQAGPYTGECYLDRLRSHPKISFRISNMNELGFGNELSEVHKSDVLRLHILSGEGGVWSDFDILYTQSLETLRLPTETDTVFCLHPAGYHVIGFFASTGTNPFFADLLTSTRTCFDGNQYQSVGSTMYTRMFPTVQSITDRHPSLKVHNLPPDVVYPYSWMPQEVTSFFRGTVSRVTPRTIGVHWYNGSGVTRTYINGNDRKRILSGTGIVSQLCREVEKESSE